MARFIRNISFFAALTLALVTNSAFAGGKSSGNHHSSNHSSKYHQSKHSHHNKSCHCKTHCHCDKNCHKPCCNPIYAPIYTVEAYPCEPIVDTMLVCTPDYPAYDYIPGYTQSFHKHKNYHVKADHTKGSKFKQTSHHHKSLKKHK